MRINNWLSVGFAITLVSVQACRHDKDDIGTLSPNSPVGRLDTTDYNPVAYTMTAPRGLPAMEVPADNPMTVQGVKLGRLLFYDKILSRDSTMACASCHKIEKAFTEPLPTSVGIRGIAGKRNAMTLINVGYNWKQNRPHNFNWDGKFFNLEDQVIAPVEHPLELDNSWDSVVVKLRAHRYYPRLFRQAFGITYTSEITKELAAKALAQFLRTLNSANSQFDAQQWIPFQFMSEEAQRGYALFLGDTEGATTVTDGECAHCHSVSRNRALFARNNYSNNGLDSAATLADFRDLGYGAITQNSTDNGRFREVTLRNVALTAPYMHDGRFNTLEQVLDHYTSGGHPAPNVAIELTTSPSIRTLTAQEKSDIIAFLHALTDTSYINKREWQNPFVVESNPWE